jgi:hypothetical protein
MFTQPLIEMNTEAEIKMFLGSRAQTLREDDTRQHLWADCLDKAVFQTSHKRMVIHSLLSDSFNFEYVYEVRVSLKTHL